MEPMCSQCSESGYCRGLLLGGMGHAEESHMAGGNRRVQSPSLFFRTRKLEIVSGMSGGDNA